MARTLNGNRTGAAAHGEQARQEINILDMQIESTTVRNGERFWRLVAQLFAVDDEALVWLVVQNFDVDFSRKWRMDVVFGAIEKRIDEVTPPQRNDE